MRASRSSSRRFRPRSSCCSFYRFYASFIIGVGLAMLFAFGNPLLAVVS